MNMQCSLKVWVGVSFTLGPYGFQHQIQAERHLIALVVKQVPRSSLNPFAW